MQSIGILRLLPQGEIVNEYFRRLASPAKRKAPLADLVPAPHTARVKLARAARWGWLLLIAIAACTPSAWERHQTMLHRHMANSQWEAALDDAHWLVNNAFLQAPEGERSRTAEAGRQLRLAQLAATTGDTKTAVNALREALTIDPTVAPAVREQLDALQLTPAQREQVKREFAWNFAALAPAEADPVPQAHTDPAECWSYRVQEVRIRQRRTLRTTRGMQRQVTYDARAWAYDVRTHRWSPDGEWVDDIGTETELVDGPPQPHYRAIVAAEHEFYADGGVPPCHRQAWRGPFEADGTLFVAMELPAP